MLLEVEPDYKESTDVLCHRLITQSGLSTEEKKTVFEKLDGDFWSDPQKMRNEPVQGH